MTTQILTDLSTSLRLENETMDNTKQTTPVILSLEESQGHSKISPEFNSWLMNFFLLNNNLILLKPLQCRDHFLKGKPLPVSNHEMFQLSVLSIAGFQNQC